MKSITFIVLAVSLLFASATHADTYCQGVNNSGHVINAEPIAMKMNQWIKRKGIKYKTSSKEITNTIKNYCKSNPYASANDATNHLMTIIEVMAQFEN